MRVPKHTNKDIKFDTSSASFITKLQVPMMQYATKPVTIIKIIDIITGILYIKLYLPFNCAQR